jgi:hypothetical protein
MDEPTAETARPFCQATGLICQGVGLLLALGGCCTWSLAGVSDLPAAPASAPATDILTILQAAPAAAVWAMLARCINLVAGLLLLTLGMGLQHDRLVTGRSLLWLTGVAALFHWVHAFAAAWRFPGWAVLMTVGALAIVWTGLFLLAGASSEELRKNPPRKQAESWTSRDEDDLRTASSPRSPGRRNP